MPTRERCVPVAGTNGARRTCTAGAATPLRCLRLAAGYGHVRGLPLHCVDATPGVAPLQPAVPCRPVGARRGLKGPSGVCTGLFELLGEPEAGPSSPPPGTFTEVRLVAGGRVVASGSDQATSHNALVDSVAAVGAVSLATLSSDVGDAAALRQAPQILVLDATPAAVEHPDGAVGLGLPTGLAPGQVMTVVPGSDDSPGTIVVDASLARRGGLDLSDALMAGHAMLWVAQSFPAMEREDQVALALALFPPRTIPYARWATALGLTDHSYSLALEHPVQSLGVDRRRLVGDAVRLHNRPAARMTWMDAFIAAGHLHDTNLTPGYVLDLELALGVS